MVVGGEADGERRSLGFSPTRPVPESEHPIAMPATSASTLKPETSVFIGSLLGRRCPLQRCCGALMTPSAGPVSATVIPGLRRRKGEAAWHSNADV